MRLDEMRKSLRKKFRDDLDKSINDILRIGLSSTTLIRPPTSSIRNFIIRSIAKKVHRKKSINVSTEISDDISDRIFKFLETENYLLNTTREQLDVIHILKLKKIMNDIHREFKHILQERERKKTSLYEFMFTLDRFNFCYIDEQQKEEAQDIVRRMIEHLLRYPDGVEAFKNVMKPLDYLKLKAFLERNPLK